MESRHGPGQGLFGLPERENTAPGDHPNPQGAESSSNENMSGGPVRLNSSSADAPAAAIADASHYEFPRWIARIFLVVEVMIWVELGMILVVVPWTRAWSDNSFILTYPHARALLSMNFARGAVTGIGLLDVWTGIWRAVHYSEQGRPRKNNL